MELTLHVMVFPAVSDIFLEFNEVVLNCRDKLKQLTDSAREMKGMSKRFSEDKGGEK